MRQESISRSAGEAGCRPASELNKQMWGESEELLACIRSLVVMPDLNSVRSSFTKLVEVHPVGDRGQRPSRKRSCGDVRNRVGLRLNQTAAARAQEAQELGLGFEAGRLPRAKGLRLE